MSRDAVSLIVTGITSNLHPILQASSKASRSLHVTMQDLEPLLLPLAPPTKAGGHRACFACCQCKLFASTARGPGPCH